MIDAMINRPVIDMTNVEGKYDISLEVSMEDMAGMKRGMIGGGMMMMHQGNVSALTKMLRLLTAITQIICADKTGMLFFLNLTRWIIKDGPMA